MSDGILVDEAPKYVETVYSNFEGRIFSKPHCDYLGIQSKGLLVGNPKNKIKRICIDVNTKEDGGLR